MNSLPFYLLMGVIFFTISAESQPQITTSPEYLCLGDLVQLTCSAQGSARWESDDILGHGQTITLNSADSINTSMTVGNSTAILLETDPRIITSLSFNLTADRVETSCTDNQFRTTTNISSVQASPNDDFSVTAQPEGIVSIMWDQPSNMDSFMLQNYRLTLACEGNDPIIEDIEEREYHHEGRLNPGLCTATVEVINSCGATSSNSITFIHTRELEKCQKDFEECQTGLNIALGSGLGVGIPVFGIMVLVIVIAGLFFYYKKNVMKKVIQELSRSKDVYEEIINELTQSKEELEEEISQDNDKKEEKITRSKNKLEERIKKLSQSKDKVEARIGELSLPKSKKKEKHQV